MSFHFSDFATSRPTRQSYRFATAEKGKYRAGLIWREIKVLDISRHGLRIAGAARLRIGQHVELRLPVLGKVQAVVRWLVGNTAGCEFSPPIDRVLMDAYVLRTRTDRTRRAGSSVASERIGPMLAQALACLFGLRAR